MHSGHAEKEGVQTHQSVQQAKSMLMVQRLVNEMRQQNMGTQRFKLHLSQHGLSKHHRKT